MKIIKIKYVVILISIILYLKRTLNIQQENYVFKNTYMYKITLKLLNKVKCIIR